MKLQLAGARQLLILVVAYILAATTLCSDPLALTPSPGFRSGLSFFANYLISGATVKL